MPSSLRSLVFLGIIAGLLWCVSSGYLINYDELQAVQEEGIKEIQALSDQERESREVYAVMNGYSVTMSSYAGSPSTASHDQYRLDASVHPMCWTPKKKIKSWIAVSSEARRWWNAVIVQGRGDHDVWVTGIKISYSSNGRVWRYIEDGKIFKANTDRNTKIRINFPPIYTTTIRIEPITYHVDIGMRVEVTFVE